MKYTVKYEEETGVLHFEVFEKFEAQDVEDFISKVKNFIPEERRYVLADVSSTNGQLLPDKEGRLLLKKEASSLGFVKIAVYGADPSVRMLGKILVAAFGKAKDTKFVSTKEEGVAWLQAERIKEA